MKRMVLSWMVVTLLVAGLYPSQAQSPIKIGVFDAQRVSVETREGKRVQANLTALRDRKQAEISEKEKDLTELQNQLSSQALSLSADKRSTLEKDIQRKLLEVNQAREAATRELQLEIAAAEERFQEQLRMAVEQLGREEGFTLIIERSLAAYFSEGVDVTTAIVDRFNKLVLAPAGESSD